MRRVIEWLAILPSTNARVAVTLCAVALTTLVYLVLACFGVSWEPSANWLTFLAAMSGIDATQFFLKRKTHTSPPAGGGGGSGATKSNGSDAG